MRVAVCLPALDHGDALSHFAVLFAEALRGLGADATVLAPIVHPKMRAHGRRASRLPRGLGSDDRIVLVHSTASPWLAQLDPPPAPTLLLYTGVTPPALCEPHAPHMAPAMRLAREQVAALAPRLRGAICTSQSADDELREITDDAVARAVVPLVIDESRYSSDAVDLERPVGKPPRLLMVGRVAPHKRIEEALAIHACLQRTFDPDVQLDIVGDLTLCPEYVETLRRWSAGPSFPSPRWWGKIPFAELLTRHREADALLFTSAHEGFGVPLLEAMWLGVPVVALHCAAAAETLGAAGLVVRRGHAAGAAEVVEMVLTDATLRRRLIESGRARASFFAKETLATRLQPIWEKWG